MNTSRLRAALPWGIAAAVCAAFDRAVWLRVSFKHRTPEEASRLAALKLAPWHQLAYLSGTLYPWALLAFAFFLEDHATGKRDPRRRATFLILSAALAGLAAEVLKVVFRRYRPDGILSTGTQVDGWYYFRPLSEGLFSGSGLGLPSSHAAVAFGAAFALARMHPGSAIVAVGLALLCAVSRVVVGAHFLSDAFAGMLIGYVAAQAIYALDRRMNAGVGIDGSRI